MEEEQMVMGPKLSIVMVGRNDNYGGDFAQRLSSSVHNTFRHLSEHNMEAEVIFVNYNPLPSPPMETFIHWPLSTPMIRMVIVTVDHEEHLKLIATGGRKDVPVLEYVAKNVGIRRAKGQFILCMNPDILLPKGFFGMVAGLRKDCYYRADRLDYSTLRNGRPSGFVRLFMKGHNIPLRSDNRFVVGLYRTLNPVRCLWKRNTVHFAKWLDILSWKVYYHNAEFYCHCDASGDFMLMHRDHWFRLGGYCETRFLSLHVDALMVVQAAASGLTEFVLPEPILHRAHNRRYDATMEHPEFREAYLHFQQEAQQMLRIGHADMYNDDNWGLATFDLSKKEG